MTPPPSSRPLLVVPCLNEAAHLPGLLDQLLADAGPDALLVVADGGSTDGSREIVRAWEARDPRVRLMHNPGRLQSAGVNRAARLHAAGRRWLIRIDAHAGYPTGYVGRLIAEAERAGADSVVVRLVTAGRGLFQTAAAAAMNSRLGAGGSAHRVGGAPAGWVDHGHHALFDLNAFLGVGGYDESFSHNEDAEFDARLRAAGGRIWLTDAVSVVYHPRSRPGALFRQYFNYGKGRARTVLKHRTPLKLRQAAPLAVAPAALMAPAGLEVAGLALPAALWAGACLSGGVALALKARRPATAAAGPVAMLMHLAWSLGFWTQLARAAAAPFRPATAAAPAGAAEAAS